MMIKYLTQIDYYLLTLVTSMLSAGIIVGVISIVILLVNLGFALQTAYLVSKHLKYISIFHGQEFAGVDIFMLTFLSSFLAIGLLTKKLKKALNKGAFSIIDKLLGGIVGIFLGLLVVLCFFYFASNLLGESQACKLLENSYFYSFCRTRVHLIPKSILAAQSFFRNKWS